MKILINDIMQIANNAPDAIKSPALEDLYEDDTSFVISFDDAVSINCIGIGYTDATEVTIFDGAVTETVSITQEQPYLNGLYLIDTLSFEYEYGAQFTISHNGTYIGRVGIGTYRTLGTSPSKEPGWKSTDENRETLSGQSIPGAGGFSRRTIDLDVRYKIDEDVFNDIETAYATQIAKNFPYFLLLDDESHKLPSTMYRFYGKTDKPLSKLQSSTYQFLYSYKFKFLECF